VLWQSRPLCPASSSFGSPIAQGETSYPRRVRLARDARRGRRLRHWLCPTLRHPIRGRASKPLSAIRIIPHARRASPWGPKGQRWGPPLGRSHDPKSPILLDVAVRGTRPASWRLGTTRPSWNAVRAKFAEGALHAFAADRGRNALPFSPTLGSRGISPRGSRIVGTRRPRHRLIRREAGAQSPSGLS
jgi:hypothetical protein